MIMGLKLSQMSSRKEDKKVKSLVGGVVVVIVTDRVGGWNERTKGLRCHEFGEGKSENKGVNVCV